MAFIGNQIITINSLLDLDGQELVLDADADSTIHVSTDDQIDFKIGGTDVVTFTNSSSDFVITQAVQDKDIIFKGDDGGSAITALTLDMSEAGAATFNNKIIATELDISGDIDVDGTANLDVVDIDGAVNLGGTLTFGDSGFIIGNATNGIRINDSGNSVNLIKIFDDGSFQTVTAGTSNLRLGLNAGNSIASGGNYNVLIGDEAGTAITTGDFNVAVGFEALKTEDAHGKNIAIGYQALKVLDAGSDGFNTVIGYQAGVSMNTGTVNTIIGHQAGDALTTGNNNVAIGHEALGAEIQGDKNVAVGVGALQAQSNSSDADANNTVIGYNAGLSVTTGVNSILIGAQAGDALTDADFNVAMGFQALTNDTLGSRSTAIGHHALQTQNFSSATDSHNTAVGFQAGKALTDGQNNTILGAEAGLTITSAASNTFVGHEAGQLTNSDKNTFVGRNAGHNITSGAKNSILGRFNGNENGLDIRTSSNNIVLSDGDGQPRLHYDSAKQNWDLQNGVGIATIKTNLTSISANTATTIIDASSLGGNQSERGFYLLTSVREGASVGTHISALVAVSSDTTVVVYETLRASSGTSVAASGATFRLTTGSNVSMHTSLIPIGIHGGST